MAQRSFKVALFDLDGTLFDTEGQYSVFWGEIGRRFHPEIPNFDKIIKGTTLKQIYERHFPTPEAQATITPLLVDFESKMKYEFFPGAKEFIVDIRSHGVKCAVVTSSDDKKMSNVYRSMPEFKTLFDKILTAEMFTASKPNPDCYILGAQVFGAEKNECVVFEDAFSGLQAGMSSGIFTFGVANCLTREQIEDKCDKVLDSFDGVSYSTIVDILNSASE